VTFWKKPTSTSNTSSTPNKATEISKPFSGLKPEPAVLETPKPIEAKPVASQSPSHSIDEDPLVAKYGRIRSALGAGTVIQGKLSFDTPVRIDGKLSGEIFSSEALIIGASGNVDAQVEVRALVVSGTVRGKIVAKERIELLAGGKIEGSIVSPSFRMEEGAVFNGKCAMSQAETRIITIDAAEQPKSKSDTKESGATQPSAAAQLH